MCSSNHAYTRSQVLNSPKNCHRLDMHRLRDVLEDRASVVLEQAVADLFADGGFFISHTDVAVEVSRESRKRMETPFL